MKFLTTNFVQCAVHSCARSTNAFPLQYSECELEQVPVEYDADFIVGILPKLDWAAIVTVAEQLGNTSLPAQKPELSVQDPAAEENDPLLRDLHTLLLETHIREGKMICRNCGHLYHIRNSIPNFLLPPHLA